MSNFLYSMDLRKVFEKPLPDEDARFRALAKLIAKKLNALYDALSDKNRIFEAGAAENLAMRFNDFGDGSGGCYEFSNLWDELSDWGESQVQSGRTEKSLCKIPTLPLEFSC